VSGLGYRPALDGVRGIAIAGVLTFHVFAQTGGSFGVHMFFVLSGFLITTILLDEWTRAGGISLRGFYRRRALRLLPALGVALTGYILLSGLVAVVDPGRVDLHARALGLIAGATYVTNVVQAWGGVPVLGLGHLWTLAAEEQFYLWWPIGLILLLKRGASLRVIGWITALTMVALFAYTVALMLTGASEARTHLGPDVTPVPLLVGCACGLLWHRHPLQHAHRHLQVAATVVVAAVLVAGNEINDRLLQTPMVVFAIAVGYLLLHVASNTSILAGALERHGLVALGRISYGVYLWHLILIQATPWVPTLVGVLLAIPVAALSYRLVERQFLRLKHRELPESVPAAVPQPI
jgi:peptidoglycan/LPS O-acetylase OafA/YrhL